MGGSQPDNSESIALQRKQLAQQADQLAIQKQNMLIAQDNLEMQKTQFMQQQSDKALAAQQAEAGMNLRSRGAFDFSGGLNKKKTDDELGRTELLGVS